jgi:diguanylate cyclase (GGDEF)-like protein
MSKLPEVATVALDNLRQTAWFARLQVATTPEQSAALVIELVDACGLAADALLCWSIDPGDAAAPTRVAGGACSADEERLVGTALAAADGTAHAQGLLAVRLQEAGQVVLLCRLLEEVSVPALLEALGNRLSLALARLSYAVHGLAVPPAQRQLERAEHKQHALLAIADVTGSALGLRHLLPGVHRVLATLMAAPSLLVVQCTDDADSVQLLYDSTSGDGHAGSEPAGPILRVLPGSPLWQVLDQGQTLSGQGQPLLPPAAATGPGAAAQPIWLGAPLRRGPRIEGALLVHDPMGGAWYRAEDRQLLEFAASHILLALEQRQDQADPQRRRLSRPGSADDRAGQLLQQVLEQQHARKVQGALLQLAQLASAEIDDGAFYARAHVVIGSLLDARNFSIALQSADASRLEFRYCVSAGKRQLKTRVNGHGLSEYVLRRGEPALLQRPHIEALRAAGEIGPETARRTSSWLGVPLCHGGDVVGVMAVSSRDARPSYGAGDEALLASVAQQVANAIFLRREMHGLREARTRLEQQISLHQRELRRQQLRRTRVQQQLEHQLLHDQLTGLPNHWALRVHLGQVLERVRATPGRRCALLYLDVDRFKVVNGSLGHVYGDTVLKEVASRLVASVMPPAMVARLSGDEFAILLDTVESPSAAVAVARRALDAVNRNLLVGGEEISPSVSIGVAVAEGDGAIADDMQRQADLALNRAKHLGRHRVELFNTSWAPEVTGVLGVEARLRHALQHGQFEPYFQPLRRLSDGKLVGFEALLRWHHPQRGLLLPQEFLKVAEDSGLIEAIDWQIFEQGCQRLAEDCPADTFLTINVSGRHLGRQDFATRLLALLERTGVARDRLIIEVTEGTLLGDPEQVRAVLQGLRDQGIGAALDDFGTGYSSLSYLHSLPLCLVKIDQAFVHALSADDHGNSSTIIAAIIALAAGLNMQVIAEGIETQEQLDILAAMGCGIGQGFLLGRPAAKKRWRDLYPRVLQRAVGKRLQMRAHAARG